MLTEPAAGASVDVRVYRLVATSIDQPGIVHRVSHTLRQLLVNIESLETRFTPGLTLALRCSRWN